MCDLQSKSVEERRSACKEAASLLKAATQAVVQLATDCEEEPAVREAAIGAIGQIALSGRDSEEVLLELVKGIDEFTKAVACGAVCENAQRQKAFVPTLAEFARSPDFETRFSAISALKYIAANGEDAARMLILDHALEEICTALNDEEILIGPVAAQILNILARGSEEMKEHLSRVALGSLCRSLYDQDSEIRIAMAEAIRFLGPHAKPALPQLCSFLGDEKYSDGDKMSLAQQDVAFALCNITGIEFHDDLKKWRRWCGE